MKPIENLIRHTKRNWNFFESNNCFLRKMSHRKWKISQADAKEKNNNNEAKGHYQADIPNYILISIS